MKAVRIHRYGGPEVLTIEEITPPEPGKGEVLIRNYATSINPADWKLRAGLLRGQFEFPLPLIPGWDVAGTKEKLLCRSFMSNSL